METFDRVFCRMSRAEIVAFATAIEVLVRTERKVDREWQRMQQAASRRLS